MRIIDPYIDLPRGIKSGGGDIWDNGLSGKIISGDYFNEKIIISGASCTSDNISSSAAVSLSDKLSGASCITQNISRYPQILIRMTSYLISQTKKSIKIEQEKQTIYAEKSIKILQPKTTIYAEWTHGRSNIF